MTPQTDLAGHLRAVTRAITFPCAILLTLLTTVVLARLAAAATHHELVLREGRPEDVLRYVDGVLLVDVWGEVVLPRDIRAAWEPLISKVLAQRANGSSS